MDNPQQQLDRLVEEVSAMMDAQQRYFRHKSSGNLDTARYHEVKVRSLLKQHKPPPRPEPVQGDLFAT